MPSKEIALTDQEAAEIRGALSATAVAVALAYAHLARLTTDNQPGAKAALQDLLNELQRTCPQVLAAAETAGHRDGVAGYENQIEQIVEVSRDISFNAD
jgi:hypothetical protein